MTQNLSDTWRIDKASPGDLEQAARLAFSHLSPGDRTRVAAEAIRETQSTEPGGLWVGHRGETLVAAAWVQVHPGRTAVVSPPGAGFEHPAELLVEFLHGVIDKLRRLGVQLVQALLPDDRGPAVDSLVAAGFRHIANLLYLVSVRGTFAATEPRDGLEWIEYSTGRHERFVDIVRQTYVESRDCPSVEGLRDVEDVLAGYQATGIFSPERWLIARHGGQDLGCLLLTAYENRPDWELLYLGVVPEARGRGWGVAIVRHAQWLAREGGCTRMVLAVDADNGPAIAVYAAAGFVRWDQRCVYLQSL